MSFALTTEQIRKRTKTVTRRVINRRPGQKLSYWETLTPGDTLNACVKCQGLKAGERIQRITEIYVVSVRRERLCEITREDVIAEGFPELSQAEFVRMFCEDMKVSPTTLVCRIEFEYPAEVPS